MTNDIILTIDGKDKIEAELKTLKVDKLPDIIDKIEQAKEMGDLSENAEYHDAKDQQGMMVARITEIEGILKKAIIQENSTQKENIQIGSNFVAKAPTGDEKEFTVVGFNEADPLVGKISNESPMGQAFINRKKGDTVEVETPGGVLVYEVLEIK